ncbi:hypothetical protein J8273_8249 [Carpediemonas membranifera]|uniref:PPi-type phosphoenolpyruvate carboxykinase lobe 2 domain-containing protein n=1 Tax=Carpediemonas membranifera TaxID=201153 RepID=A0A8J6B0C2_9EUKA|nr:hypothetical protein J8273_8249 [Carpediemonas membranifera]|eukprot:KAG9390209.1 hypothetical protein J8273_8249 [Carpediemonas membranifera]
MRKRASSLDLLPDTAGTPTSNHDFHPHPFLGVSGNKQRLADSSFHHSMSPEYNRARALAQYSPDEAEQRLKDQRDIRSIIDTKLVSLGLNAVSDAEGFLSVAQMVLDHYKALSADMRDHLCPADRRIQSFLDKYLADVKPCGSVNLPERSLICDRAGIARQICLPIDRDEYKNENISSYRVKQGVLHNPFNDRRTTKGVFHICEGGYPIPDDKIAVPKQTFANLLHYALNPTSKDILELPYSSTQPKGDRAHCWVSNLLRPVVQPGVHNYMQEKTMEVRFFAPASLAANVDFVESIFGNAGDPFLPENDAGLDIEHWTGTTGCIILCPHLRKVTKKQAGLPHKSEATERQLRDGMFWSEEDSGMGLFYHNGGAFKLCARTADGVMVTLIADNYFGYSKKEVKTMLSFSANFFGLAEEEHAGGAICAATYNWGLEFAADTRVEGAETRFIDQLERYGTLIQYDEELGCGFDRNFSEIIYVPETARISITRKSVEWKHPDTGATVITKLLYGKNYILPCGYMVTLEMKRQNATSKKQWALIGRKADGITCHKPSTVSGGGKSEISKSFDDNTFTKPVFVGDFADTVRRVDEVLKKDFGFRFKHIEYKADTRPILSPHRSLGSVIKLLTPDPEEFSEEYNFWVEQLPADIKSFVFIVKTYYQPEWKDDWASHFGVDLINGVHGHELLFDGHTISANHARIGLYSDSMWRAFKLRQDFHASRKIQLEDDITASVVVPTDVVKYCGSPAACAAGSVKLVTNCEYRFFQRPDDAVIRGHDKHAEEDLSRMDGQLFCSNYEPLTIDQAVEVFEDSTDLYNYTQPVVDLVETMVSKNPGARTWICSDRPRIVNGAPSKNVRYLETRESLSNRLPRYVAEVCARLYRRVPMECPVHFPVTCVLPGRRLNQVDHARGIPGLAVYSPLHYQELPELFMDFATCLTGASPSTTGFGMEGALTKGPFNCLQATADLNNALVSLLLTQHGVFSSAAGYIGPKLRVDHDFSLMMPELFCRMTEEEREPGYLLEHGFLEKLEDFEYNGKGVLASRLGFRVTRKFITHFFGRIFDTPDALFDDEHLKPEMQGLDDYVNGIEAIVNAQRVTAERYFRDGAIENACPPLRAVLECAAHGHYEGKPLTHPDIRAMFTREALVKSEWYQQRLKTKQERDINRAAKFIGYMTELSSRTRVASTLRKRVDLDERMAAAHQMLDEYRDPAYLDTLFGTIGGDAISRQ